MTDTGLAVIEAAIDGLRKQARRTDPGYPRLVGPADPVRLRRRHQNDYEGITGHERYRDDLTLMFFPTLDLRSGRS